jgi:AraC-like DNA-binding protein
MAGKCRIREGFPGQRLTVLPREVAERCRRLPVVRDLYVTDIGHFPSAAGHYVQRPRPRPETILIYCADGAGWCRMAGRRRRVTKGRALFIPEGVPHTYGADRRTPWTVYWVHFAGNRAADYRAALGVNAQRPLLHVPDTARVIEAFEEMAGHVRQGWTDASLLALSTALGRFLGILKAHQRALHTRGRRAQEKVLESIRFMRANLARPLRLGELAAHVYLSPSHYSALFRKQTNMSPLKFFTRLRMQQACAMLDSTDLLVSQVGGGLGYDDPFYFSRSFTRTMGLSPTRYRAMSGGR